MNFPQIWRKTTIKHGFANVYMQEKSFFLLPVLQDHDGVFRGCIPCFKAADPSASELSELLNKCLELSALRDAQTAPPSEVLACLDLKSYRSLSHCRFLIFLEMKGSKTIARPMLRINGRGGHTSPSEDIAVTTSNSMPYEALSGAMAICQSWHTEGA